MSVNIRVEQRYYSWYCPFGKWDQKQKGELISQRIDSPFMRCDSPVKSERLVAKGPGAPEAEV